MPKDRKNINGLKGKKAEEVAAKASATITGKKVNPSGAEITWTAVKQEPHISINKPDLRKEKYMQRGGEGASSSTPNISVEQGSKPESKIS